MRYTYLGINRRHTHILIVLIFFCLLIDSDNLNEYNLGIFKRINDSVERGIQLHLDDKKHTTLAFAMKHTIDNSSALKAKLNSAGMIDLAYLYQYKAGVKCSISAQVE